MGDRAHRFQYGVEEREGLLQEAQRFIAEHGDQVQAGPFAGMRYPGRRPAHVSRLQGTYEQPLQEWLVPTQHFIDVGSADGYYAVGMALKGARVDAFELSKTARAETLELAKVNGVTINQHGRATGKALRELEPHGALILSDCEGAEADIFDPETVRALVDCTLIVETHGTDDLIRERFAATHDCERRDSGPQQLRDAPTPWLHLTPRRR